ncbi:MAG: metal-sensitive transcriptional regulator [Proteobacteria bacterium]|nr:metal-sensitive transcriptional regulator [Pseudomonadota bacterium]MCP4920945.1 metal-sensitive transcriptional regulator [Pseudomonadota bacterium]
MKDPAAKKRLVTRLKRAEGQIAAVRRMVEGDHYCVDVLTQISAARGALARSGEILLRSHIESCVADAFESGDETKRTEAIEELMDVFSRYGSKA